MQKQISTEEIKSLFHSCGGDVAAVARKLGLDPSTIQSVTAPQVAVSSPIKEPPNLGKASLRKYRVSARHRSSTRWPAADKEAIERARQLYDKGTHEMCQQRTIDGWYVLYLIPRKKPDYLRRKTPWFRLEEEALDDA